MPRYLAGSRSVDVSDNECHTSDMEQQKQRLWDAAERHLIRYGGDFAFEQDRFVPGTNCRLT